MGGFGYSRFIRDALDYLDELDEETDRDIMSVRTFIRRLKGYFFAHNAPFYCCYSNFLLYGSRLEQTVIFPNSDYDFIMLLPEPFSSRHFQAFQLQNEPGVFLLQHRRYAPHSQFNNIQPFLDDDRYLKTHSLRLNIFKWLKNAVKTLNDQWDHWRITYRQSLTNFKVFLKDTNENVTYSIDIIPQMAAGSPNSENVPGFSPDYSTDSWASMDLSGQPVYFVLAFPPDMKKMPGKHLLAQANFGMVENHILKLSANVRDSVRMCKVVLFKTGARDFGLFPFHIKRMALRIFYKIRNVGPYTGLKRLIEALLHDLELGGIYSFLIPGQNLYTRNPNQRHELISLLIALSRSLHPHAQILKFPRSDSEPESDSDSDDYYY